MAFKTLGTIFQEAPEAPWFFFKFFIEIFRQVKSQILLGLDRLRTMSTVNLISLGIFVLTILLISIQSIRATLYRIYHTRKFLYVQRRLTDPPEIYIENIFNKLKNNPFQKNNEKGDAAAIAENTSSIKVQPDRHAMRKRKRRNRRKKKLYFWKR